ncbi:GAG-pre-integrase domain [Fragilaria crotonensis]|nr:GAG-pre-integrase domain [Fragilaria crotonensis]
MPETIYVQQLCAENDIQLEMTAPNTPQMNGVVERSFATCRNRAFATMYCARFSLATQGLLWPEAVNTITKIGNSLPRPGLALDPHRAWYGKDAVTNRIIGHLQPFGRIAYVTNREKLRAKLDARSKKCVFVGYAQDHSGDTYKFYDPATKQTIMSRDVHQWMEWHGRITATDDMDLFTELEKLKTDSIILPATADSTILSDEDFPDDSAMPDLTSRSSIAEDNPEVPVPTDVAASARRNLTSVFNEGAVTRSRPRQDVSHRNDDTVEESKSNLEESVDYLLVLNASLESDPKPGVPKNYKELIKSKDIQWLKSMQNELGNFLKRGAWEYVPRNKIPNTRKPLRCRWLFKEKHDGTKKSRLVVRGYEQEPGVDYVESYSPLATNTTVKVVLAMALYYMGYFDDWVTDMIDVEAAFLNALLDTDVFIEMPEGLRELLLSQGVTLGDVIIKLLRAQYGLVQSPRLWMELFSKILVSIGLKQCKTDPCLFCLFDKNGKLLAIVVVYCDDCLITGRAKSVAEIKAGISKQVKIEDLGKLSRHLGVDYKFGRDEHGPYILSSMNEYHESMIRDFEKDIGSSLKTFSTPGAAVTPPLRSTPEDEIILNEEYRSYVGRIMFACGKTEPTLSNACRELTSHLTAPNKEHWTALGHLMGYIKQGTNLGIKMRAPKDTRVVAFVDSDYASDRNDRKSISGHLVTIGGCLSRGSPRNRQV